MIGLPMARPCGEGAAKSCPYRGETFGYSDVQQLQSVLDCLSYRSGEPVCELRRFYTAELKLGGARLTAIA